MMSNDNEITDFREWKVPTKWEDLTLKQYQDISRYYGDKKEKFDAREVIHILCNKTIDEVNLLPIEFTEKILSKMTFLEEMPESKEPTNEVEIKGDKYSINVMEKLKTLEYITVDSILKEDPYDYASFLAVLCRKQGEVYDSKYEAEVFEERKKMFEEMPMLKAIPLIGFFLNLFTMLQAPFLLSSQIREGIKFMQESIQSSRENGELSAFSTRRLMKKLKKLEKSLNSIYATTSSS